VDKILMCTANTPNIEILLDSIWSSINSRHLNELLLFKNYVNR